MPLPEGAQLPIRNKKESPTKLPSLQHGFVPPKTIKLEYSSSNSPLIAKAQPLLPLDNSNKSNKHYPQPPPIPDDDKPIYQRPFYKKAKAISYTSPFLMELRKAIAIKNETNVLFIYFIIIIFNRHYLLYPFLLVLQIVILILFHIVMKINILNIDIIIIKNY